MAFTHLFLIIITLSICCLLPSSVAATTNASETDCLPLISFKSLIWDDPSSVLSSWNASVHHCQWQGVICGRRHPDRVTGLSLDLFQLAGQIAPSLGNLTFLRHLSLSDNQLSGNIPEELGRLSRLRYLNLSVNSLHGSIPYALGNCSNLEYLLVRSNNLGGTIPSSLGFLPQLLYLRLSNNNFTGTIPYTLGNLTNLKRFDLYTNSFTGSVPSSLGQLQFLNIFQINDNQISGTVPRSLYNLTDLVMFDLSINNFEDFLPPNMCDSFHNLNYLIIYQNQFKGKIPTLSNCTTLAVFDIGSNNFTGTVPSSIGSLQGLLFFQISDNQLEAKTSSDWNFIHALINCTYLQLLEASNNQLQGTIPSYLSNISSLHTLALDHNPISGSIPPEFGLLINLAALNLDQTILEGKIPIEIGNLLNLQILYLSNSMLSGEIPSALGNLTKMNRLSLGNNALEGHILPSIGNMQSLIILDMSSNKLIGEIPKEMMHIHSLSLGINMSHNHLNGSIPPEIGEWSNIDLIDLSYNSLSGQVPNTIDGCQVLTYLYLQGNMLHGPIPSSLKNIKGLQDLDLSNNSFSGIIPSFISEMKLMHLNISFNHFQGELPQGGVFNNISAIDVRGNPKLCGGILGMGLPKCILGSLAQKHHSQKIKIIAICITGALLGISLTVCLLVGSYWRRKSQKNMQPNILMTSEYKRVSYNDLFRATDNFSSKNLIGSGTFGVVYKATMSFGSGNTVAVKVLNLEQHGAIRSFLSECEALRNVRHRNLIKILSVCSAIDHQGNDFKALIFEFMPNGSLEAWLYPNATKDPSFKNLTLVQRMNIAIDVAMALDYLHDTKPVPIIHCDLKPSNVLLDDGMTAHVGDFGLARFLVQSEGIHDQSSTSTVGIKGSIGYIPPEYRMGCQASTQGDVYSYGILLLEMFTGISPTDERFKDGLSLHMLVEMAFPARLDGIIDAKLFLSDKGEENTFVPDNSLDCLVSVIQCGLFCSNQSARERTAMHDVVNMLSSTRAKLLG